MVALQQYFDRAATHSWKRPLWVGIFPLNADGSRAAQSYIDDLTAQDFADIEEFFAREAHRYGEAAAEPVHIELYPQGTAAAAGAAAGTPGCSGVMWWSLKMRWYAAHAS